MQRQFNNTAAPAIAQGARLDKNLRVDRVATRATAARQANRTGVIYKSVCQICHTERNLITYKRAEGDVTLCRRHAGEPV